MAYKILYKPKEYKKRYLLWNKNKYSNPKGTIVKTKKEAEKRVKTLSKLYSDKFKYKKVR